MTASRLSRRAALGLGAGLSVSCFGLGAAAAGVTDRKLVVIVLRGAMDGLSVTVPYADPDYAALRGEITVPTATVQKIDAHFGLHPRLANLYAMTQAGQARLAPAVAIPQRIRSHFEAQDLLESGADRLYGATSGWLNRTLSTLQAQRPTKALSIGAQEPLILRGAARAESWSPGGPLNAPSTRVASILMDLYAGDALLGPALAQGLATEAEANAMTMDGAARRGGDPKAVAAAAARFLADPQRPSMVVLSLDGFDTHANQGSDKGQLANRLGALDDTLGGLRDGLGERWKDTAVVAVTEFGRTARINGTKGTDHGTASTLILAGGALKPGGLIGDWPGLSQGALFENRDLAPTLDMRQVFKGLLIDHLGVERRAVEASVFPDSARAPALRGMV
jgi:uncharacterized protein (DUF1501 family)